MFSADNAPVGFNKEAFDNSQVANASVSPPPSNFPHIQNALSDLGLSITPDQVKALGPGIAQGLEAPYTGFEAIYAGIYNKLGLSAAMPDAAQHAEGAKIILNQLQQQQELAPGTGNVGQMIGYGLNPLTFFGGAPGEAVGEGAGLLSSQIPKYGPGISKVVTPLVAGGVGMEGAMLPSDIANNYNPSKEDIEWGGVARSAPTNIGIGMTFGATHLALGAISNKIVAWLDKIVPGSKTIQPSPYLALPPPQLRLPAPQGKLPPAQGKLPAPNPKLPLMPLEGPTLDNALNQGVINEDEYNFMQAHNNGADNSTIMKLANKVTTGYGQGDSITIPILTNDDIRNLGVAAGDQLASGQADQFDSALSDYIINNNIDNIRTNPIYMSTMQGFSDHIAPRLAQRDNVLNSIDGMLANEANTKASFESNIDQKSIYDALKGQKETGVETPLEVQKLLDHEQKIESLKSEVSSHQDEIEKINSYLKGAKSKTKIAKANQRINSLNKMIGKKNKLIPNLEQNPPKLLNVKDELDSLKTRLLSDDISPNMLQTKDYRRLNQLANNIESKSSYAKLIRARIDKQIMYDQQASFKRIADNLIAMNKLGIARQADIDRVTDYLKSRIESKVKTAVGETRPSYDIRKDFQWPYEPEPLAVPVNTEAPKAESPMQGEPTETKIAPEKSMRTEATETKSIAPDMAKEVKTILDKSQRFKANQGVFKKLMMCLEGSLNG